VLTVSSWVHFLSFAFCSTPSSHCKAVGNSDAGKSANIEAITVHLDVARLKRCWCVFADAGKDTAFIIEVAEEAVVPVSEARGDQHTGIIPGSYRCSYI